MNTKQSLKFPIVMRCLGKKIKSSTSDFEKYEKIKSKLIKELKSEIE